MRVFEVVTLHAVARVVAVVPEAAMRRSLTMEAWGEKCSGCLAIHGSCALQTTGDSYPTLEPHFTTRAIHVCEHATLPLPTHPPLTRTPHHERSRFRSLKVFLERAVMVHTLTLIRLQEPELP